MCLVKVNIVSIYNLCENIFLIQQIHRKYKENVLQLKYYLNYIILYKKRREILIIFTKYFILS